MFTIFTKMYVSLQNTSSKAVLFFSDSRILCPEGFYIIHSMVYTIYYYDYNDMKDILLRLFLIHLK